MTDRPNVILCVFDTARADAFEPYGAPAGSSPAAAQLASRGSAFPSAFATSNWTMPSHVSMLTGLLPSTAGLCAVPGGDQANCKPVLESHLDRFLPEVLRRAGYVTRGASTNLWVSERLGFATGYDDWNDLVGGRVARMHQPGLKSRLIWYAQSFLAKVDDGLGRVEAKTEQWFAEDRRPFFWFMNLIECHSPYMPPKPYNTLGPLGRVLAAEDARRYQTLTGVWRACATEVEPPRRSLERMRELYARGVRMMDDFIARLLERLDAKKMLDDTIVIVTSDHGENFGEAHLLGHAVSLDDRLIKVPVIAAGPGMPDQPDGAWSQAGLPGLIANAIGLADAPWQPEDLPAGGAVAQYDTGVDPNEPRLQIMRDWGATEEGLRRFIEAGTCATDGRYKVVHLGPHERVYDIATDPLEEHPVDASQVPNVDALRRVIAETNAKAWTPDVSSLAKQATPSSEVDDLEERMKLLGYL